MKAMLPVLLTEMRDRHMPSRSNLTSNDVILGVRGRSPPLPFIRKYHVPVALSTDDEGVSRSNMTLDMNEPFWTII